MNRCRNIVRNLKEEIVQILRKSKIFSLVCFRKDRVSRVFRDEIPMRLCTTCVHAHLFVPFLPCKVIIRILRYRTFEIERSIGKRGFCKRRRWSRPATKQGFLEKTISQFVRVLRVHVTPTTTREKTIESSDLSSLSKLDQLKTHRSNVTSTPEITFFQASPSLPPTPSLPGSREHKDKVNG